MFYVILQIKTKKWYILICLKLYNDVEIKVTIKEDNKGKL